MLDLYVSDGAATDALLVGADAGADEGEVIDRLLAQPLRAPGMEQEQVRTRDLPV